MFLFFLSGFFQETVNKINWKKIQKKMLLEGKKHRYFQNNLGSCLLKTPLLGCFYLLQNPKAATRPTLGDDYLLLKYLRLHGRLPFPENCPAPR